MSLKAYSTIGGDILLGVDQKSTSIVTLLENAKKIKYKTTKFNEFLKI